MSKPFLLILLMILVGIIGYHFIEHMNLLDSLYMTIITIFTVGFREVKAPLSQGGQIFTIIVIIGGAGTVLFALTKLVEIVYEGGLQTFLRRRHMEKRLDKIKDHYIICGHGRIGRTVKESLKTEGVPFVVIENNPSEISALKEKADCLFIDGDATNEEVLISAGIKRAKALAALLPTDADNLYLVLTVKLINPSLFVLAKALEEEAEKKIIQIGANKLVSPYKLSGQRISQSMIRPTLVDFMDLVIRRQELALNMEEFIVRKDSPLLGKSLREGAIRSHANVIVVATKKPGEKIVFNPPAGATLTLGDTLLVLGDKESIQSFELQFMGEGRA
jgi:voltage-gated potassium channel